jgi:hypothetical protein
MMSARPSDISEIGAPATVGRDSVTGQPPRLTVHSIGVRALALACAVFATIAVLGSQLGIAALYTGELDTTLATLKTQRRPVQVAASRAEPLRLTASPADARHNEEAPQQAR